jgi:hypothetical protein
LYRVPRKKPYIGWLVALAAVAVLGLAVFGIVKLFSGTPDYAKTAILLPGTNPGVYPFKDGVLVIDGRQLVCCDLKGQSLWTANLPADGMKATRQGNLTAVWGGKVVEIIDENGSSIKLQDTAGDVSTVALGLTQYAVVTTEEGQPRMRLYNLTATDPIDQVFFTDERVLGVDFYGDKLSQLWTLFIDSHGTQPMTKLYTYYPGRSSTGSIEINDEVCYLASLRDKTIYTLGTRSLTAWDHTGVKKSSRMVYGWYLQDMLVEDNGLVSFLLSPSGGNEDQAQISALWYISSDGREYKIPLPAGCIKAMIKDNRKLEVITHNGVYSMAVDGTNSRFYPVGFTIDSVSVVVPGKGYVAQTKHGSYLLPMP